MIVYLASPKSQLQAKTCENMPVLISYPLWGKWLDLYQQSFARILIDSGAFSEFTSKKKIDGFAYRDWYQRWEGHADAIAGLDDIEGNWKRSLRNYERFGGFPTFHITDPEEILPELVEIARKQGSWLGLSLSGGHQRKGKEEFLRRICERLPEDLHIHGFALREYTHIRRIDSVDSTNWWRDAFGVRTNLPWLTYGEALEIVVKRYARWKRVIVDKKPRATLWNLEEKNAAHDLE